MYSRDDWIAEQVLGGEDIVPIAVQQVQLVEIRKTELWEQCAGRHRFFALEEFISNESTKTSFITLACTQCASLAIHRVHAE